MVNRYCDGVLPAEGEVGEAERAVHEAARVAAAAADDAVLALDFAGGLDAVWGLVDRLNGYLTEQQPWQVAKDDTQRARLETILYTAAEGLRVLAVLLNAFLPKASAALWESLGAQPKLGPLAEQPIGQAGRWGQLPAGLLVTKGAVLFPRVEE